MPDHQDRIPECSAPYGVGECNVHGSHLAGPGTIPTMTKPLVIKWSWHFHALYAEMFDDENEALCSAGWASDAGNEALDCIEVWDDTGHRVIPAGEVLDRAERLADEAKKAEPPSPPVVARVVVRSPGGREADIDYYTDEAEAHAEAARLAERLGDRVFVKLNAAAQDGGQADG